jgi:hypothetical protein
MTASGWHGSGTAEAEATPSPMPGMQDHVQSAVLRAVEADSVIDPQQVRRLYPKADDRDIRRAVEVLVDEGFIVFVSSDTVSSGVLSAATLTGKGRARLAAERSW